MSTKYPQFEDLLAFDEKLKGIVPPEPDRGRWGQYIVHERELDKTTGAYTVSPTTRLWRRSTTGADMVADKKNLIDWAKRMGAHGAARDASLAAQLRALDPESTDWTIKQQSNKLAEKCAKAVGSGDGADVGNAMHRVNQATDLKLITLDQVPAAYQNDVLAREAALLDAGLELLPEYREVILINEDADLCGMADGIARDTKGLITGKPGTLVIFDDKTGTYLDDLKFGAQCGDYAHSGWVYDRDTHEWIPKPEVDLEWAAICNTPAGTGVSTIYRLAIKAPYEMMLDRLNWEAAEKAKQTRIEICTAGPPQKLADELQASLATAEPVKVGELLTTAVTRIAEPDPFAGLPGPDGLPQRDRFKRIAYLESRIKALRGQPAKDGRPDGRTALRIAWMERIPHIPPFKKNEEEKLGHDYGNEELDIIQQVITKAESASWAPFTEEDDPADLTIQKVAADDPRVLKLKKTFVGLPAHIQAQLREAIKTQGIKDVVKGQATEADMPRIEKLFADHETAAQAWVDRIAAAVEQVKTRGVDPEVILLASGTSNPRKLCGQTEEIFFALANAINLGWLTQIVGTEVHEDGTEEVEKAHLVAMGDTILKAHEAHKGKVLNATRAAVKTFKGIDPPENYDGVLASPILVALLSTGFTAEAETPAATAA